MRSQDAGAGRTLFIAGPYEFVSDDGEEKARPGAFGPLVKAYEALGYSAGVVGVAEGKKMAGNGVKPPAGWQTLDPKDPKTVFLDTPKGKVAVVFFPETKKLDDPPSESMVQTLSRTFKEARERGATLVVGVSPWGVHAESVYLDNSKPDLDILLGSGSGVGFSAKPAAGDHTLWMHTYSKGKAIYTLDLLAWPDGKRFKWDAGNNFSSQTLVLNEEVKPDTALEQMLQNVPDPGDKAK